MFQIRRLTWQLTFVAVMALTLVALAACGSSTSAGLTPPSSSGNASATAGPNTGTPPVANTTLRMSEKEYSITPSKSTAQTGKIDFMVKNDGTIVHNFAIEVDGKEVKSSDVQPGKSIPFSVTISTPGDYQFYCAIPGHRQLGMQGTLTVTGNP